jgi:hypothetical protein
MEPISSIAIIDASASVPAPDGIGIGAVRRLTIARIENRREMSDKHCTLVECRGERGERRASPVHIQVSFADLPGRSDHNHSVHSVLAAAGSGVMV